LSAQLNSHLLKSLLKALFFNSKNIKDLLNIMFGSHTGHSFCSTRGQEVMSMKRFLILSILIVFLTVSCAGPNKVGWKKPDFRQDQFENDRKECGDSIDKNLNSEAFGKALEECLAEKGYKYQTSQEAEKTKEEPTTKKLIITVGKTVGMVLLGTILVTLYLGLMFLPRK
jgi:hypothetical protein